MLMRTGAVAALLMVGAAAAWSRPPVCAPAPAATAEPSTEAPSPGRDSAAATGSQGATPSWPAAGPAAAGAGAGPATGGDRVAHPVPPGRIGVPVRLAEPTALALVHPGDRVDLLRADGTGAVAVGAPVLDVSGADDPTTGGLLLALRPGEAQSAVAGQSRGFAVLIRPD
jgi:hypothetical protein